VRRPWLIDGNLFVQFGIVNDAGIYSHGTQAGGIGTDVSQRECIQVHMAADTGQLFIGKSLIGGLTEKWSMALTRRVNKSDGSFGGVVAVSLDPHYLANFYRQIDLGKYGIVALIGADSSMRARRQGDEVSYGQDLTGSAVMKAAFEQVNGTTANVARVDGVKRLYSFRKVGDYPLWIFVASGEEEALADTNKRAHLYRWFGGILSLLILGFSLTITRDIARRKKAETRLANSEMQLRTIIENEPDCIKIVDAEGRLTFMNPAGLAMIEANDLSQVKGLPVLDVIAPEFQNEYADLHKRVIKGESAQMEYQVVGLQGGRRWLETHAVAMQSQGEVLHLAITRDIQQKKKYEAELEQHYKHLEELVAIRTAELSQACDAAEAASCAKSTFLANMSHELRTPMNGVMGMVDMALRRATDPQQIDWLNKSKSSAQHLLAVINDILNISKIEAGRLTLESIHFTFGEMLENLLSLLGHKATEKQIKLLVDMPPEVPSQVFLGDPLRLGQILINLTGNALKFTDHGSITVRILLLEDAPKDVLLRIEVADTGIGISAEDQQRLFTTFEQADGSMTRKYGGTGLGLAISKRLVQLMGGEIGVESVPGQGSTFWFTVRLARAKMSSCLHRRLPGGLPICVCAKNMPVPASCSPKMSRSIRKFRVACWKMPASLSIWPMMACWPSNWPNKTPMR
jgi:PAS domain S-box-containing protein